MSLPSTRASKSCVMPAASRTAAQLLLEETPAALTSCTRSVCNGRDRVLIAVDAVPLEMLYEILVLEVAERMHGVQAGTVFRVPAGRLMDRAAGKAATPS